MRSITPCLWFDGTADEAARFYVSVIPDSRVDSVHRAPADYPSGKAGDVLTVEFTLMGQPFVGLNGGPFFKFNEAISFQIPVKTQEQVERFTNALSAVPAAEQCGWVKDRFGVVMADRSRAAHAPDQQWQLRDGEAGIRGHDEDEAHRHCCA